MNDDGPWYFCLRHRSVEPTDGCRTIDRLGPYPDRATASRAVELAHERTDEEDRRDREWNDGSLQ